MMNIIKQYFSHLKNYIFLSKEDKIIHEKLSLTFLHACERGDKEEIIRLLTLKHFKVNISKYILITLKNALIYNNMEIFKEFIISPIYQQHIKNREKNELLYLACNHGNIEFIKFLFTSDELNMYDINTNYEQLIFQACFYNCLDVVNYLLTSPELKEHINIHINNDDIFKTACILKNIDIVTYLVFEYKITRTKAINDFLIENNKNDIIHMFEKRELEQGLYEQLSKTSFINSKNRIKI